MSNVLHTLGKDEIVEVPQVTYVSEIAVTNASRSVSLEAGSGVL